MKSFKSHKKSLLAMIAMSITCACASSAYADNRPVHSATYDDKLVLDMSWQMGSNQFEGATTREFTFNKGLTVDEKADYLEAIVLDGHLVSDPQDITINVADNAEFNAIGGNGGINIHDFNTLRINAANADISLGTYSSTDIIYGDYKSKFIIDANNITFYAKDVTPDEYSVNMELNGGALNIKANNLTANTAFYNGIYAVDADAKITIKNNFVMDSSGQAILALAEDEKSDVQINAGKINLTNQTNAKGAEGLVAFNINDSLTKIPKINLTASDGIDLNGFNIGIDTNHGNATLSSSIINIETVADDEPAVVIASANNSNVNLQAIQKLTLKGDSVIDNDNSKVIIGNNSSTLQTELEGNIINKNNGYIAAFVNNAGSSFTGNTTDAHWQDVTTRDAGNKGIHLTLNDASVWNDFDYDSTIQVLDTSKAKVDMQDDKFKGLFIGTLKGDKSTFNMDIDASTNTNNSDRLYIAGTHTGNHYITLNNVNADGNTDGAAGTVLVSVKDEQGKFFANDKEGSLYWNKYTLDMQDSATDGYTKDWYLKKVEFIPSKPTTSVDAVDATQRLAFANWVEDDKFMQRMGDLRYETNNEEGVWMRVKSGKYSGDGFSDRHTMYQLGYDDVVKENEKLKRYQGVAFSYNDGKNSFNRGSGKLKAKSIGFYSTDLHKKGHYLDLGFKIYNADSDFTVFDTEGKKITGAFDNTGISLSAKYGRNKYIDEHWSIEPQAQLTLGYLGGARYTTSNGIHVSQSDPNSVLGRIGCNFMYDMDENNTVYLKANWLHQFAGNYGVTLTNGNDSLRIDNHDHDTWFEYGLGFACMTGKNNHLYADVERSTGGSLRKNWQWNAGMFWTF
ncbi:autotransporter [Phascolarctobacterium succinatutens CAG:287]|uniref:Autotransporter n=1 Tax=Phascolarctobacterium succinatutens CAG:287 TaxID=1263101 RepID=R6WUG6_9FIRM|nr:autotransporter outer membrane beta-barrel domain-containing protein [Phascolarctobacterium succinatutens]CDD10524.1 autotransporter [Phascolarctobacterium succinatutens CAG:287]